MSSGKPLKMLVLSLTGQCNFACRYCYASGHNNKFMTKSIACKAIQLVSEQNNGEPFIIQFSGGEPLLSFSVIEAIVGYVESNGIACQMQIQTNASLLTKEIAQYLYAHHIGIGISMDGRPAINDLLRRTKDGFGASNVILKGVEIIKELKLGCGITCVISSENVEQLEGIVQLAYYLGCVRLIGFDLLRGQGRGSNLKPPTAQQVTAALTRVWNLNEQLGNLCGYKIKLTQAEKARRFQREQDAVKSFAHCHAMTGEAAFVDAEGKIYACASFVDDERFYIGNVNTGLDSERMARIHQLIAKAMSFCTSCNSFNSCGGGCLARWYQNAFDGFNSYEAECALKMFFAEKS